MSTRERTHHDGQPARRWRQDTSGQQSKVLLMTLSERTSQKGRKYLAGWCGKASVVAFQGDPDKFGNPTWDVYVSTPEQRPQGDNGHREAP